MTCFASVLYCSGQEVEAETWYTVLELVSPFNPTPELSHTAYRLYYTVTKPAPAPPSLPEVPPPVTHSDQTQLRVATIFII